MSEKPNATIIERQAINKLENCLLETRRIDPIINSNDKIPSWDGDLYLYKTCGEFSKSNLVGRIPVQVKGKWVDSYPTGKARFSVDVSDLKNYRNDGGVLFFLVLMKSSDDYRIYFDSLLPFDLRDLIESAGEQSSKTIKLSAFNHKYHDGIVHRLTDFLENREKQGQLLPNVRSIEDLSNSPLPIDSMGFSITSDSIDVTQIENEMLSYPHYIYAKPQYLDVPFAVEKLEFNKLVRVQKKPVEVDGELLYDHIELVRTLGGIEKIRIGKRLVFQYPDKNQQERMILHRDFGGTLKEYICDFKFILALAKNKAIKVGNQVLIDEDCRMDESHMQTLEQDLKQCEEVAKTLEKLNVQKDLDISSLSKTDWRFLKCLVDGILFGQPVPLSLNGKSGAGTLKIGNITLYLVCEALPSGQGFLIRDFFENCALLLPEHGEPIERGKPVSAYLKLSDPALPDVDNVDFHKVIKSIRKFAFFPLYGEQVTFLILKLLKLFDLNGDNIFMDTAIELLDYLRENVPHDNSYRINRIQAEKRRRKLTKEELSYLRTLKADGMPTQFQLAASILLESYQEAQLLYDELPDSERELFDEYPIMHLWENSPISKLPLVSNNSA